MNPKISRALANLIKYPKDFFLPTVDNGYRAGIFAGNFLVYFLIALVMAKAGVAVFFGYFPKSDFFADITKSAIVDLANTDRQQAGLAPLSENAVLDRAAQMKARDMMTKGYFEHTSPQGISPWYWFEQSGYDYRYAGENLAIGFVDSSEVNSAWLASPTHKANILNTNYRETGIAVLSGLFQGSPTTVVVQLFGSKMPGLSGTAVVSRAASGLPSVAPQATSGLPSVAPRAASGFPSVAPQATSGLPSVAPARGSTQTAPIATVDQAAPAALVALTGQALTEDVLGASDIAAASRAVLQTPDSGALPYQVASFLASGYFTAAQRFMYGSLFFLIILLAINFALKADFSHRDLLFKAVGFLVIVAIFLAVDRQMILTLVPHLTVVS